MLLMWYYACFFSFVISTCWYVVSRQRHADSLAHKNVTDYGSYGNYPAPMLRLHLDFRLLLCHIKEVRWPGWVWVGECFFWYRPTQVVPDKQPLNGCCCFVVPFFLTVMFHKVLWQHMHYARCGGIPNNDFTANLPQNLSVKNFGNWLRFDRIMAMNSWPHLFWPPCTQGQVWKPELEAWDAVK